MDRSWNGVELSLNLEKKTNINVHLHIKFVSPLNKAFLFLYMFVAKQFLNHLLIFLGGEHRILDAIIGPQHAFICFLILNPLKICCFFAFLLISHHHRKDTVL